MLDQMHEFEPPPVGKLEFVWVSLRWVQSPWLFLSRHAEGPEAREITALLPGKGNPGSLERNSVHTEGT